MIPKVVILRGISGGGKSTLAKKLKGNDPLVHIVSADDAFIVNGEYRFDPAKLPQAHGDCLRKFISLVQQGFSVIVDNTNTTAIEIAPYYQVAAAYHVDVKIITLEVDPLIAVSRNVHKTPIESILKQKMRLDLSLPPWWKHERENGEPYPR